MNEFEKVAEDVGHGIKVGAEDVAKAVEYPITFCDKAEQVLATLIVDKPELKSALTSLLTQGEGIAASVMSDVGEKGLNLADDAATLVKVKAFFAFFQATVEPVIVKVYGEIKDDVVEAAPVVITSQAT